MQERICHIESGRIKNREAIRKLFAELKDGTYLIKIATRRRRSLPQNAYYWGVVVDMVKDGLIDAGFRDVDAEDAHELLKSKFLKKQVFSEQTGEVMDFYRSTAELTTFEFSEYIEKVAQWAAEYLGIAIPLPNEQLQS